MEHSGVQCRYMLSNWHKLPNISAINLNKGEFYELDALSSALKSMRNMELGTLFFFFNIFRYSLTCHRVSGIFFGGTPVVIHTVLTNFQITRLLLRAQRTFYGQPNVVIVVHFKTLFIKETASQKASVNWVVRKVSLELCIATWGPLLDQSKCQPCC